MDKGRSDKLRNEMWKKDRSLEAMLKLGQSLENAELLQKDYSKRHREESTSEVQFVQRQKTFKQESGGESRPRGANSYWSCGKPGHMRMDPRCPAKTKTCLNCGRRGHFSNCCRVKQSSQSTRQFQPSRKSGSFPQKTNTARYVEVATDEEEDQSSEYVFNIDEGSSEKISCTIGGVQIEMVIDSGTKRNLVPQKIWNKMKEQKVKVDRQILGSDVKLRAYGQQNEIKVFGRFCAELELNKLKKTHWFYVVDGGDVCLLGSDSSKEHGVLQTGIPVNAVESKEFPSIKGNDFMDEW